MVYPLRKIWADALSSVYCNASDSDSDTESSNRYGCDVVSSDTESEADSISVSVTDDIAKKSGAWYTNYSISLTSLTALLKILRPILPDLPKDPRSLLGSSSSAVCSVQHISGGSYYYFGIKESIEDLIKLYDQDIPGPILLDLNVDGVPLFKSTGVQFWPILGRVSEPFFSDPFVIALYFGEHKPKSLDFLQELIDEYNLLKTSGICYKGHTLFVKLSALVCDAPAQAFVKNVKGHTGYSGCERCVQSGEWVGKMTFPETEACLRTDIMFDEMSDEEHHLGASPLSAAGVGLVSQFVLDYMHLVCLGVVKKLILMWMKGPLSCRLGSANIQILFFAANNTSRKS